MWTDVVVLSGPLVGSGSRCLGGEIDTVTPMSVQRGKEKLAEQLLLSIKRWLILGLNKVKLGNFFIIINYITSPFSSPSTLSACTDPQGHSLF